jgi:hypothetical protein
MRTLGGRSYTKAAVRHHAGFPNNHHLVHEPRSLPLRMTPTPRSSPAARSRDPATGPDLPRCEPEIIPPGAGFGPRPDSAAAFAHGNGIRIHIAGPGPLGLAVLVVGAGIIGALGMLMLIGTLLIGAAAAGTLMLIALITRLLRGLGRS